MKLFSINAGYFKLDGGAMFGVVPKSIWNKLNPADENNMCSWALRCLLIQENDRLILIDTGMGDKQDAKFFGYYFLHGDDTLDKSLAAHGFTRADVTDVFLTHLHFDHCGGCIVKEGDALVPAFKNATYWSNEIHWQWATQPNDREKASFLKENILPMEQSGRLQFLAVDQAAAIGHLYPTPLSENISFWVVNGHTKAMMLPVIRYNQTTIVYMADLLPATAHLPLPYIMSYDMFPLATLEEKKVLFSTAEQNKYVLFLEHDPLNECCTLQQTERGIRAKNVFALSELVSH